MTTSVSPDSGRGAASTGTTRRWLLTLRTARHLRLEQLAHRVRLRAQRRALARFGPLVETRLGFGAPVKTDGPDPGQDSRWPPRFRPVAALLATGMPSAEANAAGHFEFIDDLRSLGRPIDWASPGASQLWRFNLHYFEWAWAFAAHRDRQWARAAFAELWRSWHARAAFGSGDAWAPYVVALRSWVLCGVFTPLMAGSTDDGAFLHDIERHAWFVRRHLERDVGGNHLLKNLKALVGFGAFLGDDRLAATARRQLLRQVDIQVLGDGGHYERSPSYHCQVLEDLLDVKGLLDGAASPAGAGEPLDEPIARMRAWLGTMLHPDGDVPLFNDCTLVGLPRLALLAPHPPPAARVSALSDSGYVVIRPGPRLYLAVDVGVACPPTLPAHAHADCLSFEMSVDGQRVVVDSGTSTYAPGRARDYERSTAAHNTVEVDGDSQIEVWGAFRVGRRAEPTLELLHDDGRVVALQASHDGYRRLAGRPVHHRRIDVEDTAVTVTDVIEGGGSHRSVARLHLRPFPVTPDGDRWRAGPLELSFGAGSAVLTSRPQSQHFGPTTGGPCFELGADGPLPHRLTTDIRLADPDPPGPDRGPGPAAGCPEGEADQL